MSGVRTCALPCPGRRPRRAARRGAATSRRILDAAAEEFTERVIAAARTDKARFHAYFGSKEGLFDVAIADRVGLTTEAVPSDVEGLPGWAVGVYDQNLCRPDLVRLERHPTGLWSDSTAQHEPKLTAETQAAGRLRGGDPFDLMVLLIGMACAWSPAGGLCTATADEPPAEHDRRRALLRGCVARAVAP
ncbi:TetR/AcrR family transcriptional regulator [Actinomadura sp. DC4]|uniref:TetR/AcrR family transcriptional regulator n=1 Tax=Actinomadura sp. DC4 TaxID=3055069 RepID=UPI0025B26314|nr:TetR/AcrR family transcriptional regulator [Actinomadura sp. DC4]MDN3356131.1 TetR/AcrR family transcriptional regulator [Actinomadura sp. DC4]